MRTQGNPGISVCTTPPSPEDPNGTPNDCVPEHQTLFIPNVTTDVGLSPPFNGLFTIFGQFFDHGLDKITNGGAGTVFVPLKADDPLMLVAPTASRTPVTSSVQRPAVHGPDPGTIVTGPDGNRSAPNTETPFVDQNQTYTLAPSHQVFLREYVLIGGHQRPAGSTTGKFPPDGTLAPRSRHGHLGEVKAQARKCSASS